MGEQASRSAHEIRAWLIARLSERLRVSPDAIDIHEPLARYGLSSMEAVSLSGDLENWLDRALLPTLAYDYPTIDALARYLAGDTPAAASQHTPSSTPDAESEAIAVVGLGCRFPGAPDPAAFWELLRSGGDAVVDVPAERWDIDAYYDPDPDTPGKMYVRQGGFLGPVDTFDADFFGIAPREVRSMDPQQRLLLEVAWEALEQAGEAPAKLVGSPTGVFVGVSSNDYARLHINSGDPQRIDPYSGTGVSPSIAAGRLAYTLGLRGPTMAVDTACSSALVAAHLACQSLRRGECSLALAGGVNLMLTPENTIYFCKVRALSPESRCKTFDATADGYVRGEGCGMVVLKRLSDALADGNTVLAVIHGSAINQDGRSNGLTVPNGIAQQDLLRAALADARLEPAQVDYVEAHGTGTVLGDPIEVGALGAVLGAGRTADRPLLLGSVKTNIGHLEAAAGAAGLIKTVLALKHGEIPPHLHLQALNPHIALDSIPARIPTSSTPWPTSGDQRIAGVSSFGFSGTNVHMLVGAAPQLPETATTTAAASSTERPLHLFTLSARSTSALDELAQRMTAHLKTHPDLPPGDVAYTLHSGRAHFSHRLAVVAASTPQAAELLAQSTPEQRGTAAHQGAPSVVFLFTGQGSQYTHMGQKLFQTQPVFRAALERCDELLRPYLVQPLLSVLYPERKQATLLNETAYTQPALFALEYALAEMWRSWGITPAAVMGHSLGEYVAACVAGVVSLEDGLKLVAERGNLMQALPPDGAMATVFATEDIVRRAIAPYLDKLSIAAINAPEQTVISGDASMLEHVLVELTAQKMRARRLTVSHAFHSPLIEPMLADFAAAAATVQFHDPQIDLISNVTGQPVAAGQLQQIDYWVRHIREPVQFAASMETLRNQGHTLYLEIGPGTTLLALGRQTITDGGTWLPSLRKGHDDWQQLLSSLGTLYTTGQPIDWPRFEHGHQRRRQALPTYPFQRERYWIDDAPVLAPSTMQPAPAQHVRWLYEVAWRPLLPPARSEPFTEPGLWLIYGKASSLTLEMLSNLEGQGDRCILIYPGQTAGWEQIDPRVYLVNPDAAEGFRELLRKIHTPDQLPLRGIIYMSDASRRTTDQFMLPEMIEPHNIHITSVLHLLQALAELPLHNGSISGHARIWLVTSGAQPVTGPAIADLTQATLWGLGRAAILEHPELDLRLIDMDDEHDQHTAAHLLNELYAVDGENQVAYRQGQRYTARLSHYTDTRLPTPGIRFAADAAYMVTGGLGGLGLRLTRWLVEHGARHLVLVSRSKPSREAAAVIRNLKASGVQVMLAQADVTSYERMADVFAQAASDLPPLRGIIHAAGITDDGMLAQQTWERFAAVLAPKMMGGWNLHILSEHLPLDFFVLFSSAAAVLGSPGQSGYAAANAFLDALAQHRRSQGRPALSINWGPWAEIGMAAARSSQMRHVSSGGIETIAPRQGLDILGQLLHMPVHQVTVLFAQWEQFLSVVPAPERMALLAELVAPTLPVSTIAEDTADADQDTDTATTQVAQISELSHEERQAWLLTYLRQRIAIALELPAEQVPLDRNLLETGLDSLMIMSVINECRRDLHVTLYPRELYERPFLSDLAAYMTAEFERLHTRTVPPAPPEEPAAEPVPTLWQPPQRPRKPIKPAQRNKSMVFLLSAPRSGSTLLRVMLAGHPALFCPPELHLLLFDTLQERQEALGLSYLQEGLQRAFMELDALDQDASKTLIDELTTQNLSVQQVYALLQQKASPRLLLDKSPTYASALETLQRAEDMFTDARYIHLIRHPYAMIESFVRNRMHRLLGIEHTDPYHLAEQTWTLMNRTILDFFAQIDESRCHTLYYEDLVREPDARMRQLCAFLDIPFNQSVVQPYTGERMTSGVHSEAPGVGDLNFLQHDRIDPALGEAWRQISLPAAPDEDTRALAADLGYDIPDPEPVPPTLAPPVAAPPAMIEYYVSAGNLELCVCEWGAAADPPVLCLHGILDHGAAWEGVAHTLVERGYRVIAPDLRGHGRSGHVAPGMSYHLIDFVADVDAIVRHTLADLPEQQLTLVGHSMGATIAAMFARARPAYAGALVLVESIMPEEQNGQHDDTVNTLALHLDYLATPPRHTVFANVDAAAARLQQTGVARSAEVARRMAQRLTEPYGNGVRWRWDALLSTRAGIAFNTVEFTLQSYLDLLGHIPVPLTFVDGNTSTVRSSTSVEQRQAALSDAEHLTLPGGHNLHLDAPEALARIIAAAVARAPQT